MVFYAQTTGGTVMVSSMNLNATTVTTMLPVENVIVVQTDGSLAQPIWVSMTAPNAMATPTTYCVGSNLPGTVGYTPTGTTANVIKVTITYSQ